MTQITDKQALEEFEKMYNFFVKSTAYWPYWEKEFQAIRASLTQQAPAPMPSREEVAKAIHAARWTKDGRVPMPWLSDGTDRQYALDLADAVLELIRNTQETK